MSDEVLKWVLTSAIPAVLAAGAVCWHRLCRRQRLVRYLNALPADCHTVLRRFIDEGCHTVVLVPGAPSVTILERDGIISKKASAGTYDAVAYYFTLRQDVFDIVTETTRHPAPTTSDHAA